MYKANGRGLLHIISERVFTCYRRSITGILPVMQDVRKIDYTLNNIQYNKYMHSRFYNQSYIQSFTISR